MPKRAYFVVIRGCAFPVFLLLLWLIVEYEQLMLTQPSKTHPTVIPFSQVSHYFCLLYSPPVLTLTNLPRCYQWFSFSCVCHLLWLPIEYPQRVSPLDDSSRWKSPRGQRSLLKWPKQLWKRGEKGRSEEEEVVEENEEEKQKQKQ